MFITTVANPSENSVARAMEAAKYLKVPFIKRRNQTIVRLKTELNDQEVLVFYEHQVRLLRPNRDELFFHPSMGHVRIKRMNNGELDRMIEACRVVEGDAILDCTAGLCSDSLVFAHATGEKGLITALESNPTLFTIMNDGLGHYKSEFIDIVNACRRIKLVQQNHYDFLLTCKDNSYDVVYFDPMFDEPMYDSQSMQPLRGLADETRLMPLTIVQALRVARKTVVMKNNRESQSFRELGFTKVIHGGTNISYGVIEIEPTNE